MISEKDIRDAALRAAQSTHNVTLTERSLIIENAIREVLMLDRQAPSGPNSSCL